MAKEAKKVPPFKKKGEPPGGKEGDDTKSKSFPPFLYGKKAKPKGKK